MKNIKIVQEGSLFVMNPIKNLLIQLISNKKYLKSMKKPNKNQEKIAQHC